MNRSGIIVTGLVGVALVIGAVILTGHKSKTDTSAQTSNTSATTPLTSTSDDNSAAKNTPATSDQPTGATINYGANGFSPSTLTVKSGDIVTIRNSSSSAIQIDSNPHPLHTDDPELNIGVVQPGKSVTFKVTTSGSHGYHDHLNPNKTGTLVVQ